MRALCHLRIPARPGEVAWQAQACSQQNGAGGRRRLAPLEWGLFLLGLGAVLLTPLQRPSHCQGWRRNCFYHLSPDGVESCVIHSCMSLSTGIGGMVCCYCCFGGAPLNDDPPPPCCSQRSEGAVKALWFRLEQCWGLLGTYVLVLGVQWGVRDGTWGLTRPRHVL